MKNIAIILNCLYGGGAERVAGLLSKKLAKRYRVYLFLFDVHHIVYEYGGTLVDLNVYASNGIEYEEAIRMLKKQKKIDVSISFMEPLNYLNIKTRTDEKVIISERSIQSMFIPPHIAEEMQIKRYYQNADAMVACSYGVQWEQKTYYGIKIPITTIYNFINKDLIRQQACEAVETDIKDFLGDSEYYINIGRLVDQKNQEELIRQFIYFNIDSNKKLLIMGSGDRREELEKMIAENNLATKVRIVSYDNNPFRYMSRAIGVLVTSRYEGLPNVILEAMTIGVPVVAYDCLSGTRELLDDNMDYSANIYEGVCIGKRGIIVQSNTSKDNQYYFAKAMKLLLDMKIRKQLIKKEISYMKGYSNDNLLCDWIKVIERKCDVKKMTDNVDKQWLDMEPRYIRCRKNGEILLSDVFKTIQN